ncbi:hypothetical protein B0A78_06825 [Flavobacterium columnare NBRC 100251 = ATCC 23463]|uniref:hypothetical protein n=1 Tax=Flavobacterium columnare TaxID=996 RepID=UPI0007F9EF95|nr:hypothetical protein [Flavobacterium columnare]ANO49095.1 hypothetical protein Pf1_00847 [Flavobacterium columnare]APT22904.1 hypothetical protein BU993_09935 [Flavobacterium columnare]MBF6653795.1 hypothetical protein [Flavobacterium columnare]MBF6654518.1 hypothetical protein [Flavobacterium columnare]MEB3800260.1 hypothetical protein [Flavobacterium columnare]
MKTSKKIDLYQIIKESIELYKKNILLVGFVFFILTVVLVSLLNVGLKTFYKGEDLLEYLKNFNPEKLSIQAKLLYLLGATIIVVLVAPFNAGILKIMKDAQEGKEVRINTFFHYINSPYYFSIVLVTLLISGAGLFINTSIEGLIGDYKIKSFISFFISVSTSILTFTALPNVIFSNLRPIDGIVKSIKDCFSNFGKIFLLMIISLVLGYLGFFAFCIGIFFSFPFYFVIQYKVYDKLK